MDILDYFGKVLFTSSLPTLRKALLEAVNARAYLNGADLRGADLRGADLRGADLRGADLRGADLRGADLRGAYLNDAYLNGADLYSAYLNGADLRGADLNGAYLNGADLGGADLGGAWKIEKLKVFTGLYRYQVWSVLAQDGTRWVRMGCLFKTIEDWDQIGILNSNPDEFPNDGSNKSKERVRAFEFAKIAALSL